MFTVVPCLEKKRHFKAIFHPKTKIHSISTHPCADVRMGEDSQNTPGVSAENSVAAKSVTLAKVTHSEQNATLTSQQSAVFVHLPLSLG